MTKFKNLIYFLIVFLLPFGYLSLARAQDDPMQKVFNDYIFNQDTYNQSLTNFNLDKDSYIKNPTLSLKEEARKSLFDFLTKRNDYIKSYLLLLKTRINTGAGLNDQEKQNIYTMLDPEITFFTDRKAEYKPELSLEEMVNKSDQENQRYTNTTQKTIYYVVATIGLSDLREIRTSETDIYKSLKEESGNLVILGRADSRLFDRWFNDINTELDNFSTLESRYIGLREKILEEDGYTLKSSYENTIEFSQELKSSLLKVAGFVEELEKTVSEKR